MKYRVEYRHLDKTDKFKIELDIDDIAIKIISMNYGVHRLLSAIVRYRHKKHGQDDELANGISKLLEQGLF